MVGLAGVLDGRSYVYTQVRRACRGQLVLSGVGVTLLAVAAWWWSDYYSLYFRGPRTMDDAAIVELTQKQSRKTLLEYAALPPRELMYSGYSEQHFHNGILQYETPYFLRAVSADKVLLVKAKSADAANKLCGPITVIQRETDWKTYDSLLLENPDLKGHLLPLLFEDSRSFKAFGDVTLFAGSIALFGLFVFALIGIFYWLFPLKHWSVRRLKRLGDPTEIAAAIDHEVSTGPVYTINNVHFTTNWLLQSGLQGVVAEPLAALVWAYQKANEDGRNQHLMLCYRDGAQSAIPCHDAAVIQELLERIPWAYYGQTSRALLLWSRDRAQLLADVDARREAITRSGG